jgi:NADPH-dependent curcumin reductase
MRGRMDDAKSYARSVDVGEVMTGESVCEVIASDRAGYAAGDIVLAPTGWRTHAAWDGTTLRNKRLRVSAVSPSRAGFGAAW